MSIVKMQFASVISDHEHLDAMLMASSRSGLLHPELAINIINEDNGGKVLNEENNYSDYLNNLKNLANSIGLTIKEREDSSKSYSKEEIESFIKDLSKDIELSSCGEDVLLTEDDRKALDKLSECDFEALHSCQYMHFDFGRLPLDSYKKLSYADNKTVETCILHSNSQYHWVVVATSNTFYGDVRKLLNSLFFEEIRIPNIDVHEVISRYEERLEDIYAFCLRNDELYHLYDYVTIMDDKDYTLSGFIPANKEEEYRAAFKDIPVTIKLEDPSERPDLKAPTLLKNNRFFEPFEMFVEMYSLPDYKDFDPTAFLGITYCLLFGIMFGDLGQGFLLFLGGTYLYDIKKKKNKLFGIISRIGIFAMVFGFLFGSVFGDEEILVPVHQTLFGTEHKLIEVMDGSYTMILLGGAVAIGMILILVSMGFNIYKNYKRKAWGELLFSTSGVAGFIFYSYVIFAAANMVLLGGNVLTAPFIIIFVVLPFICFLLKEPLTEKLEGKPMTPKEGWPSFIMQGLFEMIATILEYVSNTMSFLRVGGFILSHAGMMLVVMTLVGMTGVAGPVVFVIGNLFVMGLEGLIVGIQTLRLEYYEMFSRYYDGGGKKYVALASVR